jgi:cell division FtsZ-interacting protein ZapD
MIPFLSAEVKRIYSARGETNPVVPLGLTAGLRRGFTLPAGDPRFDVATTIVVAQINARRKGRMIQKLAASSKPMKSTDRVMRAISRERGDRSYATLLIWVPGFSSA